MEKPKQAMKIADVFENTNWAELRQQKQALLEVIEAISGPISESVDAIDSSKAEQLEGLLSFLDHVQDAAADEFGQPVFAESDESEN